MEQQKTTLTRDEFEDFFTNQFGFLGKLKAVRNYLDSERNAELFYDNTRKYPFTTLTYDEAGNITGEYGAASLWQVICNNVPLKNDQPGLGWIDYLYHKSKENIRKM